MNEKVYDDIFETMRNLDKSNPVLNLKDKKHGCLKRDFHFNLLQMPNGRIGAFPPNMTFHFFRGENDDYDLKYPCVPSIYRVKKSEERSAEGERNAELILIDNLRITEFEIVLKHFPQVKYAIEDHCGVDFKALAQHYDLNTDLLDVTSDIAVAAFFATHIYDGEINDYRVKENGVGCIRSYINFMTTSENESFRMIGLQPFERPGIQCAFAVRMRRGENFSRLSTKILFR